MSSEEESADQTPPTCSLLGLLLKNRRPTGAVNEVWPDLFIGNAATARDKTLLQNLGITHVVNAADGPQHIDTGPHFYRDANIQYHGVEAVDCKGFDLSPFFSETADFIYAALSQKEAVLMTSAHAADTRYGGSNDDISTCCRHEVRCSSTVQGESAAQQPLFWLSS
ncbi:PREDICTED: dual specificity phosphatase DUPD1-like isoform X2 [Cyprinodon variegatus]|uniref:dual specificity phosphatase DUPD1-like isoform X2 n=1 Tax=Cyprinodon variegatus TaxID=28743 RepID=UPI0007429555|nr:PREDICTED: dual specificity phosphatase DUPD1-like isoform X2 [Cyprinodon variegatus]